MGAGIPQPDTTLNVRAIQPDESDLIHSYYTANRGDLLPKLQELQIILNYFMAEEPKL